MAGRTSSPNRGLTDASHAMSALESIPQEDGRVRPSEMPMGNRSGKRAMYGISTTGEFVKPV